MNKIVEEAETNTPKPPDYLEQNMWFRMRMVGHDLLW